MRIFDLPISKSSHVEVSVSGLPVGPLSVLSHYTSIEFYIYIVSLIYVTDILNIIMKNANVLNVL